MKNKNEFNVNGVSYDNFDDIPEPFRKFLDKDGNGKIDMVEEFTKDPNNPKWNKSNGGVIKKSQNMYFKTTATEVQTTAKAIHNANQTNHKTKQPIYIDRGTLRRVFLILFTIGVGIFILQSS